MRWEELLPTISKAVKAYAQTTSLIHTGSNMNRLQLYEPVDNIGVWLHTPDAEIEVIVTVTDLRLWYNYFVTREFFDFWSEYTHTNPWEDCF